MQPSAHAVLRSALCLISGVPAVPHDARPQFIVGRHRSAAQQYPAVAAPTHLIATKFDAA
jgi:hypothetical protein